MQIFTILSSHFWPLKFKGETSRRSEKGLKKASAVRGKGQKSPNTLGKMPFWAIKTPNFEKSYKINFIIWTILHIIFKAYKH